MKTCVLGGGSWGIAVALLLHGNGHAVSIWEFNPDDAVRIAAERENKIRLPGAKLPEGILVSSDIAESLSGAEAVSFVVPSHTVRATARLVRPHLSSNSLIINCAKGLEVESLLRMSQVIADELRDIDNPRICTLSGPSHAEEVALRLPSSVVIASESEDLALSAQELFNSSYFRVYTSTDLAGVELGGSVKNVIAIASGICHGLGFGDNASGALLTRGLAEIVRLGTAMDANEMTFAGLSGLGDLVTTCLSRHSRNRHLGEEIGKGKKLEQVLREMVMVAEGVNTTKSTHVLSQKLGIEMPITREVHDILFNDKSPGEAVRNLMTRELRSEL